MSTKSDVMKRKVDIVVISDIHLGTYGCHANELFDYLDSIDPSTLILNGDIIDIWAFKKSYFPTSHVKVVQKILKLATSNTKVYYLLGNHDEALRKYAEMSLGNVKLGNKLVLKIGNKRAWFFHGDIFDLSMKYTKWLAKLGGKGYDMLIMLNQLSNIILDAFGFERYSFSKKIKSSFKKAVQYIQDFEQAAIELAANKEYDYVVCGHIHTPAARKVTVKNKELWYLNCGDWIESLTSLECTNGQWTVYHHQNTKRKSGGNFFTRTTNKEVAVVKSEDEFIYEDTIFDPRDR